MDIDQSLGLKRDTWYDWIVLNVATFIFILMLFLTTFQIVVRVFNLPISGGAWWTEPLARYSLMVGTYLGAAVASRNGEHIKMTIVSDQFGKRSPLIGAIIDILAQVLTIVFLIMLGYAGLRATLQSWDTPMASVNWVQQGWIYGTITAAIGMMTFYELINLRSILRTAEFSQQLMKKENRANKEGE
ncbi:TRAP transporter small permease [Haloterrigena sp. SYSU A121-1]|uniref:TRAP transporter small permease n=1 Tax=Haloterrigena gelatinilytica TaxID=2741724 RepID=A0A8J8KDJ1_9EURY|nr:TRAP transporter small permease [Haloterrigena gelatinilytica]NUB93580.1 TRAP transporter small permease [Haloterrigena gelatinilytica]